MRATTSTERITAWQCIGCGRIEGAQPCVGICQDRRAEFVYASDHDEVLVQMARERHRADMLAALVRQLATTTPHKKAWERAYRDTILALELAALLPDLFARELEPHFLIEEQNLLPPLRDAGEQAHATRTLDEHRQLRALAQAGVQGDAASVASFGGLLETHVRFEERELFSLAEDILPAKTLAAVAAVAVAKPRQHKLATTGA